MFQTHMENLLCAQSNQYGRDQNAPGKPRNSGELTITHTESLATAHSLRSTVFSHPIMNHFLARMRPNHHPTKSANLYCGFHRIYISAKHCMFVRRVASLCESMH